MHVELVETTTTDGLVLVGCFLPPEDSAGRAGGTDVVLMMHGNGGNFYHYFQSDFARRLSAKGYAVLIANNRGHDVLSQASDPWAEPPGGRSGGFYLGTALERIADCRLDWDAWLGYLTSQGFEQVVLWGHSRGAVKTAYYLATEDDARVGRAILSSPPWFSYGRWVRSERAEEFNAHMSRARGHVDNGDPEALIWVTLPTDYVCGAASYLDSYGPAEKYNVVRLVKNMRRPTLITTGTLEAANLFPFQGLPDALDEIHDDNIAHLSIPGGDHMYSGRRGYVFDRVMGWLDAF